MEGQLSFTSTRASVNISSLVSLHKFLWSIGSQRVRCDWSDLLFYLILEYFPFFVVFNRILLWHIQIYHFLVWFTYVLLIPCSLFNFLFCLFCIEYFWRFYFTPFIGFMGIPYFLSVFMITEYISNLSHLTF